MAAGVMLAAGASAENQSTGATGGTTQGQDNTSVYGSDSTMRGTTPEGTAGSDSGSKSGSLGDQSSQDQGSLGANKQGEEIRGTVSKVGPSQLQINTDAGNKLTLKTDDQTKFFGQQGNVQSLQDIQEGEQVRASYDANSPDNHALKIEVIEKSANQPGSSGSMGTPDYGTSGSSGSSGTSGSTGSSGSSGSTGSSGSDFNK
jgi:hypothetical protein